MIRPYIFICLLIVSFTCEAQSNWTYSSINSWPATCREGYHQSPINLLSTDTIDHELPNIQFRSVVRTDHLDAHVVNTGHTIQLTVDGKAGLDLSDQLSDEDDVLINQSINQSNGHLLDDSFDLIQLHFHCPSEHSIDGAKHDCEVHLVHESPDPSIEHRIVVAVFMQVPRLDGDFPVIDAEAFDQPFTKDTGHNQFLDDLNWQDLTITSHPITHPNDPSTSQLAVRDRLSLASLLPESLDYWSYAGSLTTPPCTERVHWLVMRSAIPMSQKQFEQFRQLFPEPNARPVQPRNDRNVVRSLHTTIFAWSPGVSAKIELTRLELVLVLSATLIAALALGFMAADRIGSLWHRWTGRRATYFADAEDEEAQPLARNR